MPYVALLFIESSTGSNPFAAIGGIADLSERSGRPTELHRQFRPRRYPWDVRCKLPASVWIASRAPGRPVDWRL